MKFLKLPLKKEMSLGTWTLKRPQPPERLRVPVYTDAPFYQAPCVSPGKLVSTGMKKAEPRSSAGNPIFSPMNGVVAEITRAKTALGETVLVIEIQVDKKNPYTLLFSNESSDWEKATAERLRAQLCEAGTMLLGRRHQPLTAFLEKGPFHNKTLIVSGCESEPYVTAGQVLLMARPLEVLKGIDILRRAAGLNQIIIALSEDAGQAAEVLKSKIYFLKWDHIQVRVFPARYPQDDASILLPLIDAKFKIFEPRILHEWPLPDIATAFAAYEAVILGKPFFERVVTITGECVVLPKNLLLPMGMTVADSLKACKGVLREPGRMIAGGPMRGITVGAMDQPVSAATEALIALPRENTAETHAVECVRCGECADVCPSGLAPALIAMAAEREDFKFAGRLGADQCIGCGNCAYVCPSHLPLTRMIQESL